jgi:hypothetical protein
MKPEIVEADAAGEPARKVAEQFGRGGLSGSGSV